MEAYGADNRPDVIVGLDARGFLFGPSLALRVGAGFVPVRKKGKLPGPTETASFEKEYGADFFQMQNDAIKEGQKVIVLDDIIATGMQQSIQCQGRILTLPQVVPQPQLGRSSKSLEAAFWDISSSWSSIFCMGAISSVRRSIPSSRVNLHEPVRPFLAVTISTK